MPCGQSSPAPPVKWLALPANGRRHLSSLLPCTCTSPPQAATAQSTQWHRSMLIAIREHR